MKKTKEKAMEEFIEQKACEMIFVILHGMKKDAIKFIRTLIKQIKEA